MTLAPVMEAPAWLPVFCRCGRVVALAAEGHPAGTVKAKCRHCKAWTVV